MTIFQGAQNPATMIGAGQASVDAFSGRAYFSFMTRNSPRLLQQPTTSLSKSKLLIRASARNCGTVKKTPISFIVGNWSPSDFLWSHLDAHRLNGKRNLLTTKGYLKARYFAKSPRVLISIWARLRWAP